MGTLAGPAIEWAFSPYVERDNVLQRYVDSRPPENLDDEANIRWGATSTFGFESGAGFGEAPTVTVTYPPTEDDTDPENPADIYVDFEEVQELREETEVRVENPDDSEQYVMVKNVDVIVFEGPDLRPDALVGREGRQQKIRYRYTLHTPEN